MSEGDDNGAGPPHRELTAEEAAQFQQQQQQVAIHSIAPLVRDFAPANLSDAQILEIATKAVMDQNTFAQVIHSAVNPELRAEHPVWGFKFRCQGEDVGMTIVPKTFPTNNPEQAHHYFTLLALALSPVARAVAMSRGYVYSFLQADRMPDAPPKIILPH